MKTTLFLLGIILGTALAMFLLRASLSHANDHGLRVTAIGMLSVGQITHKGDRDVRIGEQQYPLHPDVLLVDEGGNPRGWADFRQDDFVAFHARQGFVDQLVLQFPK